MAQQPGTRTPSHSELQNHVLTLYAPLAGGGGAVVVGDAPPNGGPVVVDSTFKHATANDGGAAAYWLVVDFWHPDLTPTEVDALSLIHI